MKTEMKQKLETLAYEKTIPFCYSDYIECPTGRCPKCGSDDLQRLLRGIGNEFGVEWVIVENCISPEPPNCINGIQSIA